MKLKYPMTFAGINAWAIANRMSPIEARLRYAQFALLCAIGHSADLRRSIVFKGGNALDFVWSPNRSTTDLDFSIDSSGVSFIPTTESIGDFLREGLGPAGDDFGVLFHLHRVRQHPPGADRRFVTFEARIGYALSDELVLRRRMAAGDTSPNVIPVEISTNEPACAYEIVEFSPSYGPLRVSTVEDIVAEKLRALLQQPIRNRTRRQDLLDIAVLLSEAIALDHEKVSRFMLLKAAARGVPVTRAAFHNPEIGLRANAGYSELEATTRRSFIPFEKALVLLLAFTDQLDIPEN